MPSPPWRQALDSFAARIKSHYGPRLHAVILYGSRARGDAHQDSDIDTLVVLEEVQDFWREFDEISEIAGDASLEHEVLLCSLPVSRLDYETGSKSFLINARRDARRVA